MNRALSNKFPYKKKRLRIASEGVDGFGGNTERRKENQEVRDSVTGGRREVEKQKHALECVVKPHRVRSEVLASSIHVPVYLWMYLRYLS